MKFNSHQSLWGKTKQVYLATLVPLLTTALSVLTVYSLAADGLDTITLENQGSGEIALWVSETKNNSIESKVLRGNTGNTTFTGTFSGQPGAVIAYTDNRPPTLIKPMAWTNGIDIVPMHLDNFHKIPLSVWVVNVGDGDFLAIQKKAYDANVRTSRIWKNERQGIEFSSFDINDKTDTSVSRKYLHEPCTCGRTSELKDIGFTEGAINVYYVQTVKVGGVQGSTLGEYCASENIIVLGSGSNEDLLVHELGHAFGLDHIDHLPPADFNGTNVMYPTGTIRNFLTEGQTFRAIAKVGSAINLLYKTRVDSAPKVTCSASTEITSPDCPPIQMRIWQDSGAIERITGQPKVVPHMEALQVYLDWDHEDVLEKAGERIESLQLVRKVLEFKKDLEPEFIRLLDGGLDGKVLQERELFFKEEWARREAFLKKKPNLGIKNADLLNITEQGYIDQGRKQLIQSHQEKAIGALLAINTPNANLALKNFRNNTKNKILKEIIDRNLPSPPVPPAGLTVN